MNKLVRLILSIGKAVPAYLFLFVFVGLGFALYRKNWILSLVLAAVAVLAYQGNLPWPAAVTAGFVGAMHAMAAMLGLHYVVRFGLRGGTPVLWVDIVTFILSLASGYWIALGLLKAHIPTGVGLLSAACLLVLAMFFHHGSLRPPVGHLFQDLSKGSGNSYGRNQCTKSA